jgi:ubiquinone/menaquinone biosynthesis C-methylase UbiE
MAAMGGSGALRGVGEGFTRTASDYDAGVRHNVEGAARLVASLPAGDYPRVLDVGCGTGWATLAMLDRFGSRRVTGVDASEGMLEVFREKLGGREDVELELRAADVLDMGVEAGGYDAVICSMALHWFPDKPAAVRAMADALRPGGVLGVLSAGRGGEGEYRAILAALDPPAPPEWDAAFDDVQRDVDELEAYMLDAGLEPLDVWMERRVRHVAPEAYLERQRVVASHIFTAGIDEARLATIGDELLALMRAASGPRGFAYTFTKLFGVALKPGGAGDGAGS